IWTRERRRRGRRVATATEAPCEEDEEDEEAEAEARGHRRWRPDLETRIRSGRRRQGRRAATAMEVLLPRGGGCSCFSKVGVKRLKSLTDNCRHGDGWGLMKKNKKNSEDWKTKSISEDLKIPSGSGLQ
ncbi:hypothetical protein U1Q18_028684, partial [Sarracenia purpurea var. burkii]